MANNFRLQYLDGIGDVFDSPVQPYEDLECKEDFFTDNLVSKTSEKIIMDKTESNSNYARNNEGYYSNYQQPQQHCGKCSNWLKLGIAFGAGMLAGQVVKKLFKD